MSPKDGKVTTETCFTDAPLHPVLEFWRNLASSLPVVRIGSLDISLTLLTILVLSCLRFLATFVLINFFGWPNDGATKEAASGWYGRLP